MGPHSILRVRGGQPISGGPVLNSDDPRDLTEILDDPEIEMSIQDRIIHAGQPRHANSGPNLILCPLTEKAPRFTELNTKVPPADGTIIDQSMSETALPQSYSPPRQIQQRDFMPSKEQELDEPSTNEPQNEYDIGVEDSSRFFVDIVRKSAIRKEPHEHAAASVSLGAECDYQMVATDLHKSYTMGKVVVPVLKGVNLGIREGEFLSIIGQSGSGKSTLLHLLGTLDAPDSGKIHFDGQRIDHLSHGQKDVLRNRFIGMIFQFYHLLPELSTLENVLTPLMIRDSAWSYFFRRKKYHEKGKAILESVGLSHRLHHKPNELSGGEMQRAAIARALIAEPQILLADEPTGNLDAKSAQEILQLLSDLNKERNLTVVMVTHDLSIAKEADRMITIYDGQIANSY